MKNPPHLTFVTILGRSFVSSIVLALVETILMCVIMILVQMILYGNNAGLAGVNPFVSIFSNALFVLLMRMLLGFMAFNTVVWCIVANMGRQISLSTMCSINGLAILAMYCVWDWNYQIFHALFYVKDVSDLFGVYQTGLLCGILSPIVAHRITFVPNILPVILKTP